VAICRRGGVARAEMTTEALGAEDAGGFGVGFKTCVTFAAGNGPAASRVRLWIVWVQKHPDRVYNKKTL